MNVRSLLALLRNVSVKSVEKGEILIKEKASGKEVFFIRKGLIRSFYTDDMGDEITFQLYSEHHMVTNIHSLLFNEPSKFTYQALEDTKTYGINYASFMKLTSMDPELLKLNRMHFGKRAMKQAFQRVESFVFLSPEERYKRYVKDYPNVINRAPDKYIAHVLGITPVSLSRIRNRIASKKN
ncbi:MAG: Crp/Fnr family transcriptional regulator [Bacteroidota bacterium]